MSSFLSVQKHPFDGHDKVYHEFTVDILEQLFLVLSAYKDESTKDVEKKKPNMFVVILMQNKLIACMIT
jgi:hypothetical protein